MSALKNMPISFPGLFGDWELNIDPVAIHIGHGIYWYGIILAFAMLAGLYLCMKQAKHYGLTEDNIMDMVLWRCLAASSAPGFIMFCSIWTFTGIRTAAWIGVPCSGSGTADWLFTAR